MFCDKTKYAHQQNISDVESLIHTKQIEYYKLSSQLNCHNSTNTKRYNINPSDVHHEEQIQV